MQLLSHLRTRTHARRSQARSRLMLAGHRHALAALSAQLRLHCSSIFCIASDSELVRAHISTLAALQTSPSLLPRSHFVSARAHIHIWSFNHLRSPADSERPRLGIFQRMFHLPPNSRFWRLRTISLVSRARKQCAALSADHTAPLHRCDRNPHLRWDENNATVKEGQIWARKDTLFQVHSRTGLLFMFPHLRVISSIPTTQFHRKCADRHLVTHSLGSQDT